MQHRSKNLGVNSSHVDPPVEIGGYFELDLPNYGDPFPNMLKFQSARAALRAVLESAGIKRVLLPIFICDAVVQSVVDSGAIVERYSLDDSLYPKDLSNLLSEESVVLYVNYFGLCTESVKRLCSEVPKKQLIIDNSQALFTQPEDVMATIYSVRKFIGVPDGGLLVASDIDIKIPEKEDAESLDRVKHLLLRSAYSARRGYLSYVESEKTLTNTTPLKMSRLTNRIAASFDMDLVKRKRRENYLVLAEQLDGLNEHKWSIGGASIPLCYPLLLTRSVERLKNMLIDEGVFIPTYWPEVKSTAGHDSIEYRLLHHCLYIPCDQRYSTSQMKVLSGKVVAYLEGET